MDKKLILVTMITRTAFSRFCDDEQSSADSLFHKGNAQLYLFTLNSTYFSLSKASQIGGKWALDLHFTLLLIPFSVLILPFHLTTISSRGHYQYPRRTLM